MATKAELTKAKADRAKKEKAEIDALFTRLSGASVAEVKTQAPKKGLDEDVSDIYEQAHKHRNKLLNFFIWYTISLSAFVLWFLLLQAYVRVTIPGQENLEVIPEWALYILVVGMFGQFIGLLTIVTTKVWTFEPFFKHHTDTMKNHQDTEA